MKKTKLSGAQYRQISKQKKVISQTKKLDSFFTSCNTNYSNISEQTDNYLNDPGVVSPDLNTSEQISNSNNDVDKNASMYSIIPEHSEESNNYLNDPSKVSSDLNTSNQISDTNKDADKNASIYSKIFEYSEQILSDKDPGDPAFWNNDEMTRDHFVMYGFQQNKNNDFSKSKREYSDQTRYLNKSVFVKVLKNGEKCERTWLVYSESLGKVFCGPCLLFNRENNNSLASTGFNDWKNAVMRINQHENSNTHKQSILIMSSRRNTCCRIDKQIVSQLNNEISYWRNVLHRLVAIIQSLSSRGLSFRGHDENIGSIHNGNFLMVVELLAKFDPFMSQHIAKYGNKGTGSTSYLSSTIYEELIQLMANKVTSKIINEIKKNKYFSIVLDSTPDLSHTDQLSVILRYVHQGVPVEHFLTFISGCSHKSQQLCEVTCNTLKHFNIPIEDCRGQSYDNASNMSGQYTGLQARIREINPLAMYVPCVAHSLNLVGVHAVQCCPEATKFFCNLQHLYTFFSASTHRWDVLMSHLSSKSKTLKRINTTRWSSRDDACLSYNNSWCEILKALSEIEKKSN